MTKRNVELLEKTMQHIKDHPERHDQGIWINRCGTSACFAGWALMLDGMEVEDVRERDVQSEAADLLGLTLIESSMLFASLNTREDLERMVKALVNGEDIANTRPVGYITE